jgi:hypothetical protein
MKHRITLTSVLCLLVLFYCKPKTDTEVQVTAIDSTNNLAAEASDNNAASTNIHIEYEGASNDSIRMAMETFAPLLDIYTYARRAIYIRDSIEMIRGTQELSNLQDSLAFGPFETKAYDAIVAYKKSMMSGTALREPCPKLPQLNRVTAAGDSSYSVLPPAGASQYLADGNFFFLGGRPFIYKIHPEDNAVYTAPDGKPETRFECSVTENTNFLLKSIYHEKQPRINIAYGPPLRSYDGGPQEVNGIGSLVHEFTSRIPVYFLTAKGSVPAHLISIAVKVVPENLGCVSDQPLAMFACAASLEAEDILAVYIPYRADQNVTCTLNNTNSILWTADLNGDSIADIACVSATFEGISSDTLAEVLWFANIMGTWQIIDWGQDLDCT